MFGKGNWSIFGIEPESLLKFQLSLASPATLFAVSQLRASIFTKFYNKTTVGINPFEFPRKDEELKEVTTLAAIAKMIDPDLDENSAPVVVNFGVEDLTDYFGGDAASFQIAQEPYYGFWMVFNDFEDLTHVASTKEHLAYKAVSRPYSYTTKDEKKKIDATIQATKVSARKQFAVLLDFIQGRVYVESTNTEEIGWVAVILKELGVETFSLRWDFGDANFPTLFLNQVVADTLSNYKDAMTTRAEELSRFKKHEIEKLEDLALERIVSNFFALAELETGLWAGLRCPGRIRLHKPGDPISCSNPSDAFTLSQFANDSSTAAASVVFQELSTYVKKEVEYQRRTDLFTITLDENQNNQDAGAALLKGFDLPRFKRDMMTEIKQSKSELPVAKYWNEWLREMRGAIAMYVDNLTETLGVDKTLGLTRYATSDFADDSTTTTEVVSVAEV